MSTKTTQGKDPIPQGKSTRTARGQASPGGSGTPPQQQHQAAGRHSARRETREDERVVGHPLKRER